MSAQTSKRALLFDSRRLPHNVFIKAEEFLNLSGWIPPLITGQHATRRVWSNIIRQLEGGVCNHIGWGSADTGYGNLAISLEWKIIGSHGVLLLEKVAQIQI